MVPWLLILVLPPFVMCWWNLVYVAEERASSGFEHDVLCSCEFIKADGARGHILDCTDDCEIIEEWTQHGCQLNTPEAMVLLSTMEERLRIPWIGGSRKFERRYYPLILAPALFLFGSLSPECTVFQIIVVSFIIGTLMVYQSTPNRGFLSTWIVIDHALIFAVFILDLVPSLPFWYSFVSSISFSMMILWHFRTKKLDPGILDKVIVEDGQKLVDDKEGRPHCSVCNIVRPERSKHCRLCDHCVNVFDHHCPVMDCCIGTGNHVQFVMYLCAAVTNAFMFLFFAVTLKAKESESEFSAFLSVAMWRSAMWLVPTLVLLCVQVYQISSNLTTNERINQSHANYNYLFKKREGLRKSTSCIVFNSVYQCYYNWKVFWNCERYKRLT